MIVVKIDRSFAIGPLLMTKLALLHIQGNLFLFSGFKQAERIAEKQKADPGVTLSCALRQVFEIVLNHRI